MKKITLLIIAAFAYVVAKSPVGKLFHEGMMQEIHKEYPQATGYWNWVKLVWCEEMGTPKQESDPAWEAEKASSSWSFPEVDNTWPPVSGMGTFDDEGNFIPKDQGYTTVQASLLGIVITMIIAFVMSSEAWAWVFTGFCLVPIALFVLWMIKMLFKYTDEVLEYHRIKFIEETRRTK